MIADITKLLKGAAQRDEAVRLHELLWTIDARHHAIPTIREIAQAREKAPPFRVERSNGVVSLIPDSSCSADELTEHDVKVAMKIYQREVGCDEASRARHRPDAVDRAGGRLLPV